MTFDRFTRIFLGLFLLVIPVGVLCAQTLTTATVVGRVTDSTGAAVPGAIVRITQADTDAVRTAKAGDDGDYRFPFLKPCDYTVSAENTELTAPPVRLRLIVGREQAVNLTLGVQAVQQSISVDTSEALLQTENGNQVASYSQQYIENTPVDGGDITNVAFTTPGLRLNVGGGNANFNVNGLPFNRARATTRLARMTLPRPR
jgi:hypothetical protein